MKSIFIIISLLFPILLFAQTPPIEDLRFYTPFDGSIDDKTFNTQNPILSGVSLTTDRFGNSNAAYQFSGTDYISYEHGDGLALHTYDFSISAWVKTSNTGRMIVYWVGKYAGTTGNDGRIGLELNHPSGAGLYAYISGNSNSTEIVSSNTSINDNQWHNVTFIRSNNDLHLYLDGTLVASNTTATQRTVNNPNFKKIHIGSLHNASGTGVYFDGAIDDVAVFLKALSLDEITTINTATQSFEAQNLSKGLVSKFDFDNNEEDSLQRAILSNSTATFGADRNANTASAKNFDGTQIMSYNTDNEYSLNNNPGGQLSVALWFKSNDASNRQGLISIGQYNGASNSGRLTIELQSPTGDSIRIVQSSANNTMSNIVANSTTPISDNAWHHLVYVRENDVNVIYLDGQQLNYSYQASQNINGLKTLQLGALYSTGTNVAHLSGALDEVLVYGRGLHKPEIMALYQQGTFHYQSDTSSNLVFDADFETTADDKTGLNNLDTAMNTTTQSGINATSTAYSFIANSYVKYADSSILDLGTNKFTTALWVKSSNTTARQVLFSLGRYNGGASTGNGRVSMELNTPSGEQLSIVFSDDANTSSSLKITPTTNLTDGNWHHIAFVRSGAFISLYIDGILETKAASTLTDISHSTHRFLYLGALANPNPNIFLTGGLDDVKIFKRPLNAQDIAKLFSAKSTMTSLVNSKSTANTLKVFPSPVNTVINIEHEIATNNSLVTITNISGQVVHHHIMQGNRTSLDISHLTQGVYFVQLSNNDTLLATTKFVKTN